MAAKPDVILMGPLKPLMVRGLEAVCTVHKTAEAKDRNALYAAHAEIAACFAEKTVLLDWAPARPIAARRGGRTVLFPASALAAGIPVIATPACGLAPRAGLTLVPPMDAGALRAALVACLEKPI